MTIEKRLERVEAILDARGLDWDHPRVAEEPAKEPSLGGLPDLRTFAQPNLRWRILEPGEEVQEGDWFADAFYPRQCWPPCKGAWFEVKVDLVKVGEAATSGLVFARPVFDEPAKEPKPEHPAGPMPDPGEGYRLLSKDPPEELAEGDDFWFSSYAEWHKSFHATLGITSQSDALWFRRKIEPPKPPEPEYREPVLPADAGQYCQFSDDGVEWRSGWLNGWLQCSHQWISHPGGHWRHCRIKKDA